MTPFLYIVILLSVAAIAIGFFFYGVWSDKKYVYILGIEEGIKIGYKLGRKDANEHIDSYSRMGEWRV